MHDDITDLTDEKLLNLINNTILEKTTYSPKNCTGGYTSVTTAYGNKIIKYKVTLFFGYKQDGKTSISKVIDIDENHYYIWSEALNVKAKDLLKHAKEIKQYDIYRLIKPLSDEKIKEIQTRSEIKDRTDPVRDTPPTSTKTPITSLPPIYEEHRKKIHNFISLKEFLTSHRMTKDGKPICFKYGQYKLFIDEKGVPYHTDDLSNMTFSGADNFYKYLYENLEETLSMLEGNI